MQISKNILVIGDSHTNAVKMAIDELNTYDIEVINLLKARDKHLIDGFISMNQLNCNAIHVFSMIGGNFHNAFGLIEHPIKFDFFSPEDHKIDFSDRRYVPYNMIYSYFLQRLSADIKRINKLAEMFAVKVSHICPPPPIPDEQQILSNPEVFSDKLALGITPQRLRIKFYEIEKDVISKQCAKLGVNFIDVPAEAKDPMGFLVRDYWRGATHANAAYGALIIQQLRDCLS